MIPRCDAARDRIDDHARVTDRDIVEQLAGGRTIVALDHVRARTEGVIGIFERDDRVLALCAHRCELTELDGVAALHRLERLDVGGNRLRTLPVLPASLRELYVYDNELERLPDLPALRVLDANRNRLIEVPPLTDLEHVYLAGNRLAAPPTLVDVRYVNLSGNPLAHIESLGDHALLELRLEDAGLRELPEAIRRLGTLRELHLRGNALASIPAWLGELVHHGVLDLRNNQLDELPDELAELKLLKLDLRWNPLRRAPRWLATHRARGCLVYE